ncbi:cupin domain-containing protein [Mucilaginibacter sp. 14171R-50]|uniref:cupin domain-containing protein n=1 Tax=Mucilaginibacter sp. 14171R-50 TaxID=2703789 RepID=UPI00138C26CC|nr:cupin domain-containing protein [Mucilaginibacter sp. 14171R-50]QHS55305.1 cupin domain-containing protein [Mucilaginibacter sp. 14171R-50]
MQPSTTIYQLTNRLGRARYYMGGYWVFLATATDTAGQFSLIEANLRQGMEPPAHVHTNEDESFHLLEGEMLFTADGKQYQLKAGEFLHLPKGVQHTFKVLSPTARVLIHLVPAGLEAMFLELSQPATALDYPTVPAGPPPAEWLECLGRLQQQFGIRNVDNRQIRAQ